MFVVEFLLDGDVEFFEYVLKMVVFVDCGVFVEEVGDFG